MNEIYEERLAKLRSDIDSLVTQMNMMNPAAFLEFRGTVLAALKEYDNAISLLEKEAGLAKEKAQKVEIDLAVVKAKAAIYASIAGAAVTIAVNILIALLK